MTIAFILYFYPSTPPAIFTGRRLAERHFRDPDLAGILRLSYSSALCTCASCSWFKRCFMIGSYSDVRIGFCFYSSAQSSVLHRKQLRGKCLLKKKIFLNLWFRYLLTCDGGLNQRCRRVHKIVTYNPLMPANQRSTGLCRLFGSVLEFDK